MVEEKCKKCGMPLEKPEDKCSCEDSACYHCCSCGDDCKCGCKDRE